MIWAGVFLVLAMCSAAIVTYAFGGKSKFHILTYTFLGMYLLVVWRVQPDQFLLGTMVGIGTIVTTHITAAFQE